MTSNQAPLLQICGLEGAYGESKVLHGIDFNVFEGEVVTLLGRNGAGKSTTMRAIMGLLRARSGSIRFGGTETIQLPSFRIAKLGLGYCPEERAIFSGLNVHENLMLPPVLAGGGLELSEVYSIFPQLLERRTTQGTKLSGGQQQMLAIARILRTGAKLLLLDEPTEGLAPVIVQQIGEVLRMLKRRGFTILLVEQNFRFASKVADRHYVVDHGHVVDMIPNAEIDRQASKLRSYLGV